jgi:TolA-binding protein
VNVKDKIKWSAALFLIVIGVSFNESTTKAYAVDKNSTAISELFDVSNQNLKSIASLEKGQVEIKEMLNQVVKNQDQILFNQSQLERNQFSVVDRMEILEKESVEKTESNESVSSSSDKPTPSKLKKVCMKLFRRNITWMIDDVNSSIIRKLFGW